MRHNFFNFCFQHAFNLSIRFLDGRSSSLLFVSVILLTILPKGMTIFKKKFSSSFNSACKSSSNLCVVVPREAMVCDIFHTWVTNSILFLILFFTYPLEDASRVEDAFTLVAGVTGMAIAKGSTSNGIGMKASSSSLTRSFSLAFWVSMRPMESCSASPVAV
jgi:hypothetical protein